MQNLPLTARMTWKILLLGDSSAIPSCVSIARVSYADRRLAGNRLPKTGLKGHKAWELMRRRV
jgi:hypothetical protein